MTRNIQVALGLVVGLLIVAPGLSEASKSGAKCTLSLTHEYTPSVWTQEMGYAEQMKHKFIFGGKNTLLGWMELYNEPRESIQAKQGFFRGMGRGIVNTLGDTVGGVLHFATFPITALDVPLPEGGTNIL